uniref:Uncharacterized protein n=1 Tax=Brassica oleracea var. oleracea TaxID=109376 RepID=A0A0D3AR69_BRAOL
SSKRNSSSHSSSGDSSANEVIAPKQEFEAREVAKRTPYAEHGLSRLSHDSQGLLPDSKWSRISDPELQRECEEPSGRFLYLLRGLPGVLPHVVSDTCYEASLVYFRMWFPIPGSIVRALHHFGLSISQLSVPALQHWLGVLISSYEVGMDLNPGDFEGFWFTRGTGIDGSYRMAPKKVWL